MNNTVTYDINQSAENLIGWIKYERATTFEGEINIPSREFALRTLIDTYSKIDTQQELTKVFRQKLRELMTIPKGAICAKCNRRRRYALFCGAKTMELFD
jgi:hypothetical protein